MDDNNYDYTPLDLALAVQAACKTGDIPHSAYMIQQDVKRAGQDPDRDASVVMFVRDAAVLFVAEPAGRQIEVSVMWGRGIPSDESISIPSVPTYGLGPDTEIELAAFGRVVIIHFALDQA